MLLPFTQKLGNAFDGWHDVWEHKKSYFGQFDNASSWVDELSVLDKMYDTWGWRYSGTCDGFS